MTKKLTLKERVESLNIIDDSLFHKMAEDIGFCEEIISTILGEKVEVLEVIPQASLKNLQGRSVITDALCKMENGSLCITEVQKADDDDHVRRVRLDTSCVTVNTMNTGTKFKEVPDVIAIFISKFDIFKAGKTVYHIDRKIRETGEISDNGLREIYVNTKNDDGTEIAELMRIFSKHDAYDYEKFPRTSERKHNFLVDEGGREEMCEIVEEYAREVAEEVAKEQALEHAKVLFESDVAFEIVRKTIKQLSDEELQEIYESVKGTV